MDMVAIMKNRKNNGRNALCRCGSGVKNKFCCKDYRTDDQIAEDKIREEEKQLLLKQKQEAQIAEYDKFLKDQGINIHEISESENAEYKEEFKRLQKIKIEKRRQETRHLFNLFRIYT